MRSHEFIIEKRRNPEVNTKEYLLHTLIEIQKKYENQLVYVVFNDIEKFGINPSPKWNTPLGIYGYPIDYVIQKQVYEVPFANDSPYIYVYAVDQNANLLNLDKDKQLEEFKKKLDQVLFRYYGKVRDQSDYYPIGEYDPSHIRYTWYHMYNVMRDNNEKKQALTARNILVDCGYEGVIDNGNGIIHENEPYQGVFFNKKILTVIDKFNNIKSKINRTGQDLRTTTSSRLEMLIARFYNGEKSIAKNPKVINYLKKDKQLISICQKYFNGDINQVPEKDASCIIRNSLFLNRLSSHVSTMFIEDLVKEYDITQNPVVYMLNAVSKYMNEKGHITIVKALPDFLYRDIGFKAFIYSNSDNYGLPIINNIKDQKYQEMFMSYNQNAIGVFFINEVPVNRSDELIKLAIAANKISPSEYEGTRSYIYGYEGKYNMSDEELQKYVLKALAYKKEFVNLLNNFKSKLASLT